MARNLVMWVSQFKHLTTYQTDFVIIVQQEQLLLHYKENKKIYLLQLQPLTPQIHLQFPGQSSFVLHPTLHWQPKTLQRQ